MSKKLKSLWFQLKEWYYNKTAYKHYYITFTEELVMARDLMDYTAGRIEICNGVLSPYSIREQRVFTKDRKGFLKEMEKYEFKSMTLKKINKILPKFYKYNCVRC